MDLAKVFNLSSCPKCGCREFTSHGRYQTAPKESEDDLSAQETVASDEPYDKVVYITCCNCGHVVKEVSEQAFRMARWTES